MHGWSETLSYPLFGSIFVFFIFSHPYTFQGTLSNRNTSQEAICSLILWLTFVLSKCSNGSSQRLIEVQVKHRCHLFDGSEKSRGANLGANPMCLFTQKSKTSSPTLSLLVECTKCTQPTWGSTSRGWAKPDTFVHQRNLLLDASCVFISNFCSTLFPNFIWSPNKPTPRIQLSVRSSLRPHLLHASHIHIHAS